MILFIKAYLKGKKDTLQLVKESALSFFLKILGIFLSYLFALVVSHKFGAEGWGIFSLISTIALILIYILKFGFDTALLRITANLATINERNKIKGTYFLILKIILPTTLGFTFLLLMFSDVLAELIFHKPQLERSLFFGAFILLPYVLILINSEGLRGLNRVNEYVFLQNVGIYLITILLIFSYTFFFPANTNTPLLLYVVSLYIVLIISVGLWFSQLGKEKPEQIYSIQSISRIALPMWLSGAMMIIIGWADTLLLGIYSTEENVGIYNVALKTANIVLIPQATINNIIAPKIVASFTTGKMEDLKIIISKFAFIILITSLPAYLVLILFPEFVLGIFGAEFIKGKNILIILATSQFINALFGSADIFLQMVGKERVFRNFITIATFLNVAINIIVIPKYGAYGAAFTAIISILAWKGVSVLYIKYKYGINMLPALRLK